MAARIQLGRLLPPGHCVSWRAVVGEGGVMVSPCPTSDMLRSLLAGRAVGPHVQELEAHLVTCSTCVERARTFPVEDPFIAAAQREGSDSVVPEERPVLDDLLLRARSLWSSASTSGAGSDELNDLLPRLGPPAALGEIGSLGPYRLTRVLGAGGMGVVFEAIDERLGRAVAVKLMRPGQEIRAGARERFLNEARALAALCHDHIVPVYEVGDADALPFIVMPLLQGQPLSDWLRHHERAEVSTILAWGRELAAGLAAAHERGLVHRDIKPANIWLESIPGAETIGRPARVKILDFGLVRTERSGPGPTREGMLLGTPEYLSPEQARGEAADARSDLFSLGCVLYELCTGNSPFRGPTVLATLSALATITPPRARALRSDVPVDLDKLIGRMLAKRPEDRPATAAEVSACLQRMELGIPGASGKRGQLLLAGALLFVLVGVALAWLGAPSWKARSHRTEPSETDAARTPLRPMRIRGHSGVVTGLVFEPAGDRIVSSSADGTVRRWNLLTGREQGNAFSLPAPCTGLALSSDLRTLAVCAQDGTVRLYDLGHGEATLGLTSTDPTWGIAFRGSEHLYTATDQGAARWIIGTRQVTEKYVAGHRSLRWVDVSSSGKWLVAGSVEKDLWFYDLHKEHVHQYIAAHRGPVRAGAFSPDGNRLASVGPPDENVRLWDLPGNASLESYPLHPAGATAVAWSPQGHLLASGGANGSIKIWEANTGKVIGEFSAHATAPDGVTITCLRFSADARTLASGGADRTIGIWDVSPYTELQRRHPES